VEAQTTGVQPHVAGVALDHELVVGEGEVTDATGDGVHSVREVAGGFNRVVLRWTIVSALWDHWCAVKRKAALAAS